jgi:hypothetical protein
MRESGILLSRLEGPVCALLAVAAFLPYWSDSAVPYHDALFKYQFFHYAYSEFVASGELPMWLPYGSYGLAAMLYQLSALTPALYLAGAVGAAVGASDTLLLFKSGVFLEVLVYAAGVLLLARSEYRHALARLLVLVGAIGSLSWLYQPYFNFYWFYLYPYVLLFVFAFLRSGDPGKLWLAAAVGAVTLIGNPPYLVPIHMLVILVLCGVAIAAGARPPLARSPAAWLLRWEAGIALGLGAVLSAALLLGSQELTTIAFGRDADTFRVPLTFFLEYGRLSKSTVAVGYLAGTVTNADNTYYIGLLPLILVAIGLVRLGHPLFLGVTAAACALVWLSFGGGFARLAYHLPAMSLFRHIGLTFGICGLLLLVASGWVLDDLLARTGRGGRDAARPGRYQGRVVLLVAALLILDLAVSWREGDGEPHLNQPDLLFVTGCRVLVYLGALAALYAWWRAPPAATAAAKRAWTMLAVAYLLDMTSFQAAVQYSLPRAEARFARESYRPEGLPYRPTRGEVDGGAVPAWKIRLLEPRQSYNGKTYIGTIYALSYTFAGIDPCHPAIRQDHWHEHVLAALKSRGGQPRPYPRDDFLPPDDTGLKASLGCGVPKVRLLGSGVAVNSPAEAREQWKSSAAPHEIPVLETDRLENAPPSTTVAPGSARVLAFGANRIAVEVINGNSRPAWLYYADAFHRDWRARVDGAVVPLVRANVGFKAVRVAPGRHTVEMVFGEGPRRVVSALLALAGVAASLAGSILAAATLARRRADGPK